MANKFYINGRGYRQVLNDRATQTECLAMAQYLGLDAQTRGGGPYRCDVRPGVVRAHARVTTDGAGAFWRETRTRALSRSIPRKGQMGSKAREKYRQKLSEYYEYMRKRKGR